MSFSDSFTETISESSISDTETITFTSSLSDSINNTEPSISSEESLSSLPSMSGGMTDFLEDEDSDDSTEDVNDDYFNTTMQAKLPLPYMGNIFMNQTIVNLRNTFEKYNNSMYQIVRMLQMLRNYMDNNMGTVLYEESTNKFVIKKLNYPIIDDYVNLIPIKSNYIYPVSENTVKFVQDLEKAVESNYDIINSMIEKMDEINDDYRERIDKISNNYKN